MMQRGQPLVAPLIRIINAAFLSCRRALHLSRLCPVSGRYALLVFAIAAPSAFANHAESDGCPDIHVNGGESLSPDVTIRDTGQPVYDGMVVPTSTFLRFHMIGTAYGQCEIYKPAVGGGCYLSAVHQRLVAGLPLALFAKTTSLNGDYFLGQVAGKDPATGTTAFYHVLDSHDETTSSGPLEPLLANAGIYRFRMRNGINGTICKIQPSQIDK
jgi:hypothetical protein